MRFSSDRARCVGSACLGAYPLSGHYHCINWIPSMTHIWRDFNNGAFQQRHNKYRVSLLALTLTGLISLCAALGARASELKEVVVTAQKYRQRAFDVPISLDVISGRDLERLNVTSLSDLQYDVAGLYVQGGNVNQYIVLRGVSNTAGNGALVGQYIDDADISADGYAGQVGYGAGAVRLFDLKRVEVLKGPQGTLYGDGALGGVVRYVTHKPRLDAAQLGADVSASFTQDGAPSERLETMLNVPVVTGSLGLRVAGQFLHRGGWVDEPKADLKDINYLNVADVRMEALWKPSRSFRALATQVIHHEDYGIGAGEDSRGNITPVYGTTYLPNGRQRFELSNLTMTANFPVATVVSSSTYLKHTQTDYNESYTFPGEVALLSNLPVAISTFSEELRLNGVGRGPWQWTFGSFYKREVNRDDDGASEYFGPPGPLSSATHVYIIGNREESSSAAVFFDTSINVLDRVVLGAGARYFRSSFRVQQQGELLDQVALVPANGAMERFSSTDPRFYVQYHAAPGVNVYVNASKGFRSGEPDIGLFRGFSPESLWSYDLGLKARLFQGRVRANSDVFYEKYSNYVGEGLETIYGVPTFGTFNIGAARIRGVDADVKWEFHHEWTVGAKAEVVSSKFVSITAGDTGFVAGQTLPFVPRYTFVSSLEHAFDWRGRPAFFRINYSQTARVQGYQPGIRSDVIRLLNLRLGVTCKENLRVAAFAQNILNDRGYLDPYWSEGAAYRPRPRTFGFELAVSFE